MNIMKTLKEGYLNHKKKSSVAITTFATAAAFAASYLTHQDDENQLTYSIDSAAIAFFVSSAALLIFYAYTTKDQTPAAEVTTEREPSNYAAPQEGSAVEIDLEGDKQPLVERRNPATFGAAYMSLDTDTLPNGRPAPATQMGDGGALTAEDIAPGS
ncbi:MAG: hypothetical protein Q7V63_02365 [Gammaproteobacteria bacterium]|nr:hypothetical protein [Gammaproteobacteria bacterium]